MSDPPTDGNNLINNTRQSSVTSGWIREAVMIAFTLGVWVSHFLGKDVPGILVGIYATMIGYYFEEIKAIKRGDK